MTQADFERLRFQIAEMLDDIHTKMFVQEMMLTLIVRHPTDPKCFIVVTADNDMEKVVELLENPDATSRP